MDVLRKRCIFDDKLDIEIRIRITLRKSTPNLQISHQLI